ncbi:AzlD domain-containing protein [Demequina lutea]|uniref:Branched-subunit amino acid transport protein n=1 Tax=Demequina lutea TaxID=431489 RepID=A0A7Y9Z704_9MICO|nr:AzlD domain-containing protein [Demequina lutea]NYI39904.1 branched-subunit amino acid transport protein [Demequina lutea]
MRIWIVVVLAGIGTYLIRASGILIFQNEDRIPPLVRRALRMIGPATMGAIVGNALFLDQGAWRPFGAWHIAALVAVAAAVWKRNLALTMLAGAAAFAVLLLTVY